MSSSIIDVPKIGSEKDQLGIDAYKNGLTSFIKTAETPLTIAIQGEWGSGKTSLLNSINYDLCEDNKPFHGVWVNTWEYSLLTDEYSTMIKIISGIINSVISILEADKNENVEKLKKKALSFIKSTTKTALKTGSSMFAGGLANDGIDELFDGDSKESTLKDLHKELQEQINLCIENSDKKGFLFFIDDLDRINPPVAVKILELLKNIFDLKNCIFLLAIDYDVVVKGLEPKFGMKTQHNEREFRSFFEKIIQLPFTMPVGQYKIDNLILGGLERLNYFGDQQIDNDFKADIVNISNLTVGSNPRAIKRLLNSLSLVKSITKSVNSDDSNDLFQEIINIGVFSIQISYPTIYRALERYPNFSEWNNVLVEEFKLDKIDEELKVQLSTNEFFDEEWEQVLYQLCNKDKFLSNRGMKISRLLNLLITITEKNIAKNKNELEGISIGDIMSNSIQISSVTSFSDNENEHQPQEIHKSGFLKTFRDKTSDSLIANINRNEGFKLTFNQKRVESTLFYSITKPNNKHPYRLEFSIRPGAKNFVLSAYTHCWYYVKAIHKDFELNLNEERAIQTNARARYEEFTRNIQQLEIETPEEYSFATNISKNDKHNTVRFIMDLQIDDAWNFLEQEKLLTQYILNVEKFVTATKQLTIID